MISHPITCHHQRRKRQVLHLAKPNPLTQCFFWTKQRYEESVHIVLKAHIKKKMKNVQKYIPGAQTVAL